VRQENVESLLSRLPSGRHGLPREQVVRSQRLRLLGATIAVAGSEGYAAMTVSSVIGRANVSRKTFYEQFADREHCFVAAYELLVERALTALREAYSIEAPWPERLRAAIAWALDAVAEHPHAARVAFVEALAAGDRALAVRERAFQGLASLFAPGFDAAPAGAAVPGSMPLAIAGAFGELVATHVRRDALAELPGLLPDLLFCGLAPFVGPLAATELVAELTDVRAPV
jgi:AcrR family transcriptional regulator